jgi:GH24 family phage-related lysozyme (muramidase)
MMYDTLLAQELVDEESFETHAYKDHKGNWTIGVGHLLGKDSLLHAKRVWTQEQVMIRFMTDMNSSIYHVRKQIKVFDQLSPARQRVLVSMMFNMGPHRFSGFVNTIAAIHKFDYHEAYIEMLDSKWANYDVPNRAKRTADKWLAG